MLQDIRLHYVGIAALLVFAVWIRMVQLEYIRTIQADEYVWILSGVSILEQGVPSSWTIRWPYYDQNLYHSITREKFGHEAYNLVTPWLDHPTLFSIMIAAWIHILPSQDIHALLWSATRVPMVGIAIATMVCTFLYARRLFGLHFAMATLAAYVFFPAAILSARFILAESAIVLWFILALLLAHVFVSDSKHRRWSLVALMALAVTAPWLKLSGLVVPGALALIFTLYRRYRLAAVIAAAGAVSVLAFILYGWAYDWEIFVAANQAHAIRPQSVMSVWSLFTQTNIANVRLFDPSIVVGFIGVLLLATYRRSHTTDTFLLAPLLASIAALLVLAPAESSWYKFQLYPLIAIGLGYFVTGFLRGNRIANLFIIPLVLYVAEQHYGPTAAQLKIVAGAGVLAGVVLFLRLLPPKVHQVVAMAIIAGLFILEALWIVQILDQYVGK